MQFKSILVFVLVLIVSISGCLDQSKLTIFTSKGEVKINAEIADEDRKRQRGLMFRDSLDENSGMLFIFDKEQQVSFWMKNTKIPLDMIFVSANGTIIEIKENVQPCLYDPCPIYSSQHPTKYVIEVNAGFSRKNNIQTGNLLKLDDLKYKS